MTEGRSNGRSNGRQKKEAADDQMVDRKDGFREPGTWGSNVTEGPNYSDKIFSQLSGRSDDTLNTDWLLVD